MSQEIETRLKFMSMGSEQRKLLSGISGIIARLIPPALDRFYGKVRETPETKTFFRDPAHMQKAQSAQERHWLRIAQGRFDDEFYASVRRIGSVHAAIGLEPRWYVGAYALVLEHVLVGLGKEYSLPRRLVRLFSGPSQAAASAAIVKAALLDMELSISIYFEQSQEQRNKAIEQLSTALQALSAGDLTTTLEDLPETFASIERDYNGALVKLRDLVGGVVQGAGNIQVGSSEIAQAAEDLARRTESTAASLEQTSAAVSQMDGRLKATSAAASQTVDRADQTIATVASGRSVAERAVEAMSRVSESATGIDSVIEGLDKIAFQTRVLAMNAAVEAGRAGDSGRGFAVVADLVSALAMRAEEEAKRARSQLTTTQSDIASAVSSVENVDSALERISSDVEAVHLLLGRIASDNQAQATAISEINSAISSMDRTTQQNAAMVEETSAAARNLASEVITLTETTGQFTTVADPKSSGARQLIADAERRLRKAA